MTKPRQNSSIWSCVRRRRNGKCRRVNGARRKPSSPSCSKTGSSWHDGQPAPHTRFLIVPLRSGCAWRLLPDSFPPRQTVYGWFLRLRDDCVLERLNHHLVMLDRAPASPSSPGAGSLSASSPGSAATAASPRTSRQPSNPPEPSSTPPPSCCSPDGSRNQDEFRVGL